MGGRNSKATRALSTEAKARAKAAILGGLVADAATMPMHWLYDLSKINELLAAESLTAAPEFFPTASCPYYKAAVGEQSPYGHEILPLLKSAAEKGEVDAVAYSQAMVEYYAGPGASAYQNHSTKAAIANYQAGKRGAECGDDKDFQANCFLKAAVTVAKYGGTPELLPRTEAAIRVQQNNDDAVKFGLGAARMLEKVVVNGWSVDRTLKWAASKKGGLDDDLRACVETALGAAAKPLKEFQFEAPPQMKPLLDKLTPIKDTLPPMSWSVVCIGLSCSNPGAFTCVMLALASCKTYVDAVRANLVAGGDNCSRGSLIGTMMAAQNGMDAIPAEWRAKTKGFAEAEAWVDKLLA